MMITPHFSQEEFTRSQVAIRQGIDNTPIERQWVIVEGLCREVLEPARELFSPITLSSGYRCPELNRAIGGSGRSDHMVAGRSAAADIWHARLGDLFRWIYIQLPWSRLIWEYGRWVHVSWCADGRPGNRRPQIKFEGEDYKPLKFEDIVVLGR